MVSVQTIEREQPADVAPGSPALRSGRFKPVFCFDDGRTTVIHSTDSVGSEADSSRVSMIRRMSSTIFKGTALSIDGESEPVLSAALKVIYPNSTQTIIKVLHFMQSFCHSSVV